MPSDKKIDANRHNSQKSTGPKTPEGKAAVRFNSLIHGLRAKTVVLPGEDQQEFDNLVGTLEETFEPQNAYEDLLIEKMAIAEWKVRRVQDLQNKLFAKDSGVREIAAVYDRLLQMEARLERSSLRASTELRRIRTERMKQADKAEKTDKEEAAGKESEDPCFLKGMLWRHSDGLPYEAVPPRLKRPDGTWEHLYPGDPRRKQYGWDLEPDRDHCREWDPKTDPRRQTDPSPSGPRVCDIGVELKLLGGLPSSPRSGR
jgi:hypothetical protein